jgi:hypothetical protein
MMRLIRRVEKPIDGQQAHEKLGDEILGLIESRARTPIPRSQILVDAKHLEDFVIGDDGLSLLTNDKNRLVESAVILNLQDWLRDTKNSQTLWISGPLEPQYISSTRSAGLAVVSTALEIQAPFISHFCAKPSELPPGHTNRDKSGLIGLVCSLIYQLLQFNKDDSDLDLRVNRLQQLNGSEESWSKCLAVLKDLLHHTKYLPYCVIHALNIFEWSASDWCCELLDVLFQHQREPDTTFSILFTTSGQSRVLSQFISVKHRYRTTLSMREVERRGRPLNSIKWRKSD